MAKRKKYSVREKNIIEKRAHYRCEYCQWYRMFSNAGFNVEHIIPLIKGGDNTLFNIAFSCRPCNANKHTKTEGYDTISNNTVPLYNPRTQNWLDHFAWSEDNTLIIGISPIGRVTVNALDMNREELVFLRRVFYDLGIHPPTEY